MIAYTLDVLFKVDGAINAEEIIYQVKDNRVGFDMTYAPKVIPYFSTFAQNGRICRSRCWPRHSNALSIGLWLGLGRIKTGLPSNILFYNPQ